MSSASVVGQKVKKLPIAETFVSPQGEGLYAGVSMLHVRLAGCSVGKPQKERAQKEGFPLYVERCATWDGREFDCDTNFQTSEVLLVSEILARVPQGVKCISITGGEPLNYDLSELLCSARASGLTCHIETSGSVHIKKAFSSFEVYDLIGESVDGWLWITVSPKIGCTDDMAMLASQLKLLVDDSFDPMNVPESWRRKELVYISPINFEHELNLGNVQRCIDLQKQFPHWRICIQIHKVLGVR